MKRALFAITPPDEGLVSLQVATDAEQHMSPAWARGFIAALGECGADPAVRCVVLEGGTRVFCAGASRDALLQIGAGDNVTAYAADVARALLETPVPIVAALAGHAIGGGLLLALWCDTLVLAEEGLYGANFMALGFTPGMGATAAVEESFGAVLGRRLLFTGELVTGRAVRDARCPLSHAVCPRAQVRDRALATAREMAAAPRDAIVLLKRMLAARRQHALEGALRAEGAGHVQLFADSRTRQEIARRYVRLDDPSGTS